MPPRGVSSRVPRPNRGNNKKRGPNSPNQFEYIPSISRSSGIEHDGDTYVTLRIVPIYSRIEAALEYRLKDLGVQDEYRQFLQQKVMHIGIGNETHRIDESSLILTGNNTPPSRRRNLLLHLRNLR
jgi:hypothetical protein